MQSQNSPARNGPRGMVFPVSGAPITLEEVEERTRTLPAGATDTEILREKILSGFSRSNENRRNRK
jgi:hypothetical protein